MRITPAVVESDREASRADPAPWLTRLISSVTANRLVQLWTSMDVAYYGKYSIERLESLRHYSNTTSLLRAVSVCVATPVPALATMLLLESIPLQPPREGWRANWGFWLRIALSMFIVTLLGTCHMVTMVAPLHLSLARCVAIAAGTACGYTGFFVALASVAGFPVPMMWQLGAVPGTIVFPIMLALAMGRSAVFTPSVMRAHVGRYLVFFAVHMSLLGLYPLYMAIYDSFPPHYQVVALLVLPLWRAVSKYAVILVCRYAEDFLPALVAFVVDVFDSLFLSVCLQNATSVASIALVLGIDCIHSTWCVHEIKLNAERVVAFLRAARVHHEREQHDHPVNLLELLVMMAENPGSFEIDKVSTVRLWAFLPHEISPEASQRLKRLQDLAVYRYGRGSISLLPATSVIVGPSRNVLRALSIVPDPSSSSTEGRKSVASSESSLVRVVGGVAVPGVRGPAAKQVLVQGLRLLFHCEYLLLVEYVECILPIVYVVYVSVVAQLSNTNYYPMHRDQQKVVSLYMLTYSVLEIASLVALGTILRRKFCFSPIHQLAYVLETQAVQVQALLFLGIVCLLQFKLEHLGECDVATK